MAIGKELTLINPLSRCLSKYFRSTQSLFQDIPYRGLNPGYFSSLIAILQLYSQRSSSLLASSYQVLIVLYQYFYNRVSMLFYCQGLLNIGHYKGEDCIFGFPSKLYQRSSSNYTDIQSAKLIQIIYYFLYRFLFGFSFSIRYRVSIRFEFRFFKYSFYSWILVLLVVLYTRLKLLLSLGRRSS